MIVTILAEELASGLALSPPGSGKAEADHTAQVQSRFLDGSEESVGSLDFERIVLFQLLKSDSIGIRDLAGVSDELSVGIDVVSHMLEVLNK